MKRTRRETQLTRQQEAFFWAALGARIAGSTDRTPNGDVRLAAMTMAALEAMRDTADVFHALDKGRLRIDDGALDPEVRVGDDGQIILRWNE
jgi:hypothetical protein